MPVDAFASLRGHPARTRREQDALPARSVRAAGVTRRMEADR